MITTKDLESLGWKHKSTAKNGGSKLFYKGEYSIFNHADNFLMRLVFSTKSNFEEIIINKVGDRKSTEIWKGIPKDIQDLKRILVETGADMEWLPELRDQKIKRYIK
jgi:hypothetical protein